MLGYLGPPHRAPPTPPTTPPPPTGPKKFMGVGLVSGFESERPPWVQE